MRWAVVILSVEWSTIWPLPVARARSTHARLSASPIPRPCASGATASMRMPAPSGSLNSAHGESGPGT